MRADAEGKKCNFCRMPESMAAGGLRQGVSQSSNLYCVDTHSCLNRVPPGRPLPRSADDYEQRQLMGVPKNVTLKAFLAELKCAWRIKQEAVA